jgi:DNA-binding PadR family transcriptional regulator
MYELIILALLVRFSIHGYLISSIINDIIGPYARISNGRLYPLLAKLEEGGFIEVCDESEQLKSGERNSRRYHITELGKKRFHTLMMDTTSNPGEYQRIFMRKVSVLHLLEPSEQLYLIDHYINYCQTHVLHLTAEAKDMNTEKIAAFANEEVSLAATLGVMRHMADQWRLELEWALCLRLAHQEER